MTDLARLVRHQPTALHVILQIIYITGHAPSFVWMGPMEIQFLVCVRPVPLPAILVSPLPLMVSPA